MNLIMYSQMVFIMAVLSPPLPWEEGPGMNVRVSNLSPLSGTVEVSLFDSSETFMKEPSSQQSGSVNEDGSFEAVFMNLPAGEYAVVVVHDANDNGKLDSGFLGFGGESYGYSNNIKPWFGRPDFEQVKIQVDKPGIIVEIDLE